MSAKKLRSKLDINFKFFRPRTLSSPKALPPSRAGAVPGISPDFSEKMFRKPVPDSRSPVLHIDAPPPPPPKDKSGGPKYSLYGPPNGWDDVRYAVMACPIAEEPTHTPPGLTDNVIIISHQVRSTPTYPDRASSPDELGILHPPASPRTPPKPAAFHTRSATSRIPIAASRMTAAQRRNATISTPEEAELRRREAQRRRELEEQEAQREEAQRQARLKYEKQQQLLEAEREEEARRAALEQELRCAAEEKRKRHAIEQEAEALSTMVAAEQKRQDKERRRQETAKLQRMRLELEAQHEAQRRERREWRERVDRERRLLAAQLEAKKTKNSRGLTVLLTGWITVQSEDLLSYKRRYFQLREDALLLFKDAEDDWQPLHTIQLSRIQRIREWQDGYEDLQAIPNSFALEIRDLHDPWSMFTDSSEDKENLLAVLSSRLAAR